MSEKLSQKDWFYRSQEIQAKLIRKGVFKSPDDEKRFLAMGLAGEVGELCNFIKKDWRGDLSFNDDDIQKEIADCFIYLSLLAFVYGMDEIDRFIELKLDEVEKR